VSTRDLSAIAQLADELKFYWSVLHTAVRLNRNWHPNLKGPYTEAEQDALSLGRQLAGETRHVATLADVRILGMERIESALERLTNSLEMTAHEDAALELIRQAIFNVAETGRLLFRGVDIRSCRCTGARSARRRLVKRLGQEENAEHLQDAVEDLATLACMEAERLLTECLTICRASGLRVRPDFHQIN
jgi:hypothetical protein